MSNGVRQDTRGILVISLDFELMWGMFDKVAATAYEENLRGVHTAVPRILQAFATRNIHATWATVGLLTTDPTKKLRDLILAEEPQYLRSDRSAYMHLRLHTTKLTNEPDLYFAPHLVEQINITPGQELASHTYAHYYCTEPQVSESIYKKSFAADCAAQRATLQRFGIQPRSLVFPRNQVDKTALQIAHDYGVTSYRGNETSALYRAGSERSLPIRLLRLLDNYVNLTGHHTYPLPLPIRAGIPLNIPASRFLRPYNKNLAALQPLQMRRIKDAMTHAATAGELFHLWWHPHNFGINQNQNFQMLESILKHFESLRSQYGMRSLNMVEVTHEHG